MKKQSVFLKTWDLLPEQRSQLYLPSVEMWFLISLKEAKKSVQVRKNKENIEVIAEMGFLLSLKVVKNPVKAEKTDEGR